MSLVIRQFIDPSVQLGAWVLIGTIAIELLVAIWAAIGPQHWFWRGLGLWAAVMVMAPLEAWQVMWVLVFAAAFIIGVVQLSRGAERYRLRRRMANEYPSVAPYRYSLSDLMLLDFLICLWLPGLATAGREARGANWLGLIAAGAVWAGLAVMAMKMVFGPRRVRAAILLAIALPLGAIAMTKTLSPVDYWFFVGGGGDYWQMTVSLGIVGMELVLVLVVVSGLFCVVRTRTAPPAMRWISGIALTALASMTSTGLGYVYWELLQRPPQVIKFELPGNQFSRIRAIAQRVYAINRGNLAIAEFRRPPSDPAVADELAALYAELLPILRQENASSYDPETDATEKYTSEYLGATVQPIRNLCRSLQAEAEWAHNNGQPNVAADYGLACLGLSESLGRGGIALDALISRALEGVSYAELAKMRGELSSDKLRDVLAALARDAERRDDFDTIRSRDLDFMNRAAGFPARLQCTLLNLTQRKSPWEESLGEAIRRHTVSNALLRAELAMQLFNREKGYCPSNLEELVPEYLPAVPIDAYSGDALKCQATADGLLIYSVGRDGIDDGGRLTNTATYWSSKAGYDYDVDTLTRK